MSDLKKLKRMRGAKKGAITRITDNLDDTIERAEHIHELKGLMVTVEDLLKDIGKYSDQLYDLYEDDVLEVEMVNDAEYMAEVNIKVAQLLGAITDRQVPTTPRNDTNAADGSRKCRGVKLPSITLPTFKGDPTEWVSFWELFSCSVGEQKDLSDIQKFTYLKGQLRGEALQLISGFSLTGNSYAPAMSVLRDTYGQQDRIKAAHISNLCGLGHPDYEADDLKAFFAKFECAVESMRSMEVSVDEICAVILHNKLPHALSDIIKRGLKEDWLNVDAYVRALREEICTLDSRNTSKVSPKENYSVSATPTAAFAIKSVNTVNTNKKQDRQKDGCKLCNHTGHYWGKCMKYKNSEAKVKRAKQLKLCTGCLSSEHGVNNTGCSNPKVRPCFKCGQKHYYFLCLNPRTNQSSVSPTEPSVTMAVASGKNTTLLPTIQVPMLATGTSRSYRKVRALLDQCSQRTFILRSTVSQLSVSECGREKLQLRAFLSSSEEEYEIVELSYQHRHRLRTMRAVVVEELPEYKPGEGLEEHVCKLKERGFKLADHEVTDRESIDMLIGGDYYYDLVHSGYQREGSLVLIPTIYGYTLSGKYQSSCNKANVEMVTVLKVAVDPVQEVISDGKHSPEIKDLTALWELDHIGIRQKETDMIEKQVLDTFTETVQYDAEQGKYSVELPWQSNSHKLPDNFKLALGRLRGLQRKFVNDPTYCKQYQDVMTDQLDRGFIEKVEVGCPASQPCHYLAHHGVKKDSKTTPIRVVFDCSARLSPESLSLNDCLYTGPSLVSDLTQVLLRFRCNTYAWVSDIEKAFLNVGLCPRDRDATRFLWPRNPMDPDSPYDIYRFKVVLFGSTSSQFLLNATIQKHLSTVVANAETVAKLTRGLYIDNLQATSDTDEDLIKQCWDALEIFGSANLFLREWVTNSEELRGLFHLMGIASESQDKVKVLGIDWLTHDDVLKIKGRMVEHDSITKRIALSLTASVFDPLGILLPVTIRARRFVQNLWRLNYPWDEALPEYLQREWRDIYEDILTSSDMPFPRQVTTTKVVTLHVFSDASTKAYGVAAYLVSNGTSKLLMAKAKVTPIKPVTIPRLELTAVLLAARLSVYIHEAYADVLKIENTFLWSDSQITLYWLSSRKVLPVYIQNRKDEVKSLIPNVPVRYVNSGDNPSDLVTRGLTAKTLQQSTLWWGGPSWLPHQSLWPADIEGSEGCEHTEVTSVPLQVAIPSPAILNWDRYDSYRMSWHVMAWVLRFVNSLHDKMNKVDSTRPAYLTVSELRIAEKRMIALAQKENYNQIYQYLDKGVGTPSNLVKQLDLYMEGELIRCRGRIQLSKVKDDLKYPILLPSEHRIVALLISHCHVVCSHSGVGYVVSYIRQKWWIPRIRQIVKKVLRGCLTCKRLQGKPYQAVQSPPLPEFRVQELNPFQVTGVDYTGSLPIKGGDVGKMYIVLFTCAVTRAVHVEIVSNLSCESFLHVFRRFCSRRGFPQLLLSDNASTFVSGAKVIRELTEDPRVRNRLADVNCEWRFIPARAPWFGAIWERIIGVLKAGLKKVLGRALITAEELQTVVLELEATVNDRPLGYTFSDLNDPLPITPSQLVIGRRLRDFPRLEVTSEDLQDSSWNETDRSALQRRLQHINKLSYDLWKRWRTDYLLSLREQHKHISDSKGKVFPQVGDVVLIHDEGPRLMWRLGRVTKLYLGSDNMCRVCEVKTGTGLTTRPMVKLFPLEINLESGGNSEPNSLPVLPNDSSLSDVPTRPSRRAALGSSRLWRSMIGTGQL